MIFAVARKEAFRPTVALSALPPATDSAEFKPSSRHLHSGAVLKTTP
jgi:hypothetical protein